MSTYNLFGSVLKEVWEEKQLSANDLTLLTDTDLEAIELIATDQYPLTFGQVQGFCEHLDITVLELSEKYFKKYPVCDGKASLKLADYDKFVPEIITQLTNLKQKITF